MRLPKSKPCDFALAVCVFAVCFHAAFVDAAWLLLAAVLWLILPRLDRADDRVVIAVCYALVSVMLVSAWRL